MQKIRRFLICCLIWVGLVPGRSSLAADAASGAQDPAARARLELERQASQSSGQTSSTADNTAKSAAELQNQAKALAAKQTTAPGPKVRYATSRPVKLSPPPPSAEEVARQERLAQIEREVERRRAERAGTAPAAVAVANKPQEVSPVPPATTGVVAPAPAPVVVSRETVLPTESEEKQRNQSLREKLAADRARLAADREAAEQQKAQQRQRREGLAFSNQTPPPAAALAPAPAQPVASRDEAERKARVDQVQSELDSKQFAQNSAGGASRGPLAGPAPSLPVLSLDQERKARELLRQTLAELEQEEAAAGKKAKPAKTAPQAAAAAPAPTAAPKPALAPAPAPAASPAPSPELELKRQEEQSRLAARELIRQEGERVEAEKKAKAAQAKIQADRAEAERRSRQAQEAQAKADAKASAERAKADADKARADARLQEAKARLHTRTDAERAAETQAKKAAAAPAPAVVAAPTPTTKAEKLAALLKSYTRSESPISAEEYHRERAKLLSEP